MIPEMSQNFIHRCIFLLLLVITLLQFAEVALSHHPTYYSDSECGKLKTFENCYEHTLWNERLHSDGQHFQQYQQNEQSPLTSNHWKQKRHRTLVMQVMDWDKHTLIICRSQIKNVQNARHCIFKINFYFHKQSPLH